jgi:hypothetical protein
VKKYQLMGVGLFDAFSWLGRASIESLKMPASITVTFSHNRPELGGGRGGQKVMHILTAIGISLHNKLSCTERADLPRR